MLYAVALKLLGLHRGLMLGFVTDLLSFVPYLGSLTGLIVSLAMTAAQFGLVWPKNRDGGRDFLRRPVRRRRLTGAAAGWSACPFEPVWLTFALFAFGYLFGFFGLLVAVPLAAAIGVLVRFSSGRYRAYRRQCWRFLAARKQT